jgi:transcriptional regulator
MYVPQQFALSDQDRIVDLIERNDFALMITALDGRPTAVHLPFLYDPSRGEKGILLAHMAKANPQWQDFEAMAAAGGEALVIFQGPHAYISPSDYRSDKPNVPTWNYLAVHAYGCPRVISEPGAVRDLLSRLSEKQEAGRSQPWRFESLPEKFSAAKESSISGRAGSPIHAPPPSRVRRGSRRRSWWTTKMPSLVMPRSISRVVTPSAKAASKPGRLFSG